MARHSWFSFPWPELTLWPFGCAEDTPTCAQSEPSKSAFFRRDGLTEPCQTRALFRRRLEEAQVRRRLVLAGGHQVAVPGQEVALSLDDDVAVTLRAVFLGPVRCFLRIAAILLGHRPGPRQRFVDGGDLVEHHVRVGLVD